MSALNGLALASSIIERARARGITLHLKGGKLYASPREKLDEALAESIRSERDQIIRLLQMEDDAEDDAPVLMPWQYPEARSSPAEQAIVGRLCNAIEGGLVDFHERLSRDIEHGIGDRLGSLPSTSDAWDLAEFLAGKSKAALDGLAESLHSDAQFAAMGIGSHIEEAAEEIASTVGQAVIDQGDKLREEIKSGFDDLNRTIAEGFAAVVAAIREQKAGGTTPPEGGQGS